MKRNLKHEDNRFIIKYTLGSFSTFVEVFSNFTCKTYETVYDAASTEYTLSTLINMAEAEAINRYVMADYDGGYYGI